MRFGSFGDRFSFALGSVLILSFITQGGGVPLRSALAQTPSATPDADKMSAEQFEPICRTTLDQASQIQASSLAPNPSPELQVATQRLQFCQAASESKNAYEANGVIWKAWAGVATVCAAACAASLAGAFTNQYVCLTASVGGMVFDAMKTQEYVSLMTSLPMTGMGLMMNSQMNQDAKSTNRVIREKVTEVKEDTSLTDKEKSEKIKKLEEGKEKEKDVAACLAAITAGGTALMKNLAEDAALESLQRNLASAAAVTAPAAAAVAPTTVDLPQLGATAQNVAHFEELKAGTGSPDAVESASSTSGATCGSASTGGAVVACAVAQDSTLPPFARSPKFLEEVGKFTGLNPDQFFTQSGSAQNALLAGIGGSFGGKNPGELHALVGKMKSSAEAEFGASASRGSYSIGGGGGSRGGGDSSGPDFTAMMGGLMGALGPKDGKGAKDRLNGVSTVSFAVKQGKAWQLPEDKTVSLFDRVTFRYWERVHVGALPALAPVGTVDENGDRIEVPSAPSSAAPSVGGAK